MREPVEFLKDGDEPCKPVGGGALVHAEQPRALSGDQAPGDRLVGQDHRLLHKRGGIGLATQVDARGPSVCIEAYLCLRRGEIDSAGTPPQLCAQLTD